MLKVNILFPFNKYGGGGNQFLKILKKEFINKGIYEENPAEADIIMKLIIVKWKSKKRLELLKEKEWKK